MQNNQINGISSTAVNPQINYVSVIEQLRKSLIADVQKIQLLMQNGTINKQQGQFLLADLANRSKEIDAIDNFVSMQNLQTPSEPKKNVEKETPAENPFEAFNSENPGFFERTGREEVLNYIKNLEMDKDEISKIAKLVELLENSAVEGYLKKSSHEKSLNDENTAAKSKLTSYAQNSPKSGNFDRIFTREDIGRMSGEEFTKNEKIIAEQARLGLIK